jgi:hypothetical protein
MLQGKINLSSINGGVSATAAGALFDYHENK